jgi:hypothetical protein
MPHIVVSRTFSSPLTLRDTLARFDPRLRSAIKRQIKIYQDRQSKAEDAAFLVLLENDLDLGRPRDLGTAEAKLRHYLPQLNEEQVAHVAAAIDLKVEGSVEDMRSAILKHVGAGEVPRKKRPVVYGQARKKIVEQKSSPE